MNVLTEATIVITMLDATIMMLHLLALVILGIEEMALIVKVSSGFDLQSFYPVLKPTQTYSCQGFLIPSITNSKAVKVLTPSIDALSNLIIVLQLIESSDINFSDINECTDGSDNCHHNATCNNYDGSFNCICNSGYTGSGANCEG